MTSQSNYSRRVERIQTTRAVKLVQSFELPNVGAIKILLSGLKINWPW